MLNSERLVDLKHKPRNGDCRTPGVVNTGRVDVMKIWSKLPQWLPRTSLTNFQIMAQRCRVGCSVKQQQNAKLHQTCHTNKYNTGAVSSWATSCSWGCFMSKPNSRLVHHWSNFWFLKKIALALGFLRRSYISSIVQCSDKVVQCSHNLNAGKINYHYEYWYLLVGLYIHKSKPLIVGWMKLCAIVSLKMDALYRYVYLTSWIGHY